MKTFIAYILSAFALIGYAQVPEGLGEDDIRQLGEDEITRIENQNTVDEAGNGAVDAALEHYNTVVGMVESAEEMYEALDALSNNECSPDFATSAAAMMPLSCREEGECAECYQRAVGELNFVRRQLGRLNCIYQNTRNFTNSAIAFGDNASGIHAVTGLAWQSARAEINAEYDHFKGTYDSKYHDMIGSLERALRDIDVCESRYGQEGWYQRSGFIYLEFMKEKYRRTD